MLTHILCTRFAAAIIVLLSVACSTERISQSGQRLCRVHSTPLITVDGFGARPEVIVDPSAAEVAALRRYPHFIQSGASLYRSAGNPVPTKLTYCPECEAAVKRMRGLQRI